MEYPIRVVLHRDTDRATYHHNHYNNDNPRNDHHYSGDDNHNMGDNYNIHGTDDDLYYYCPNNECPCRGTTDHRTNDNHLVFYYSDNDYSWEHHLIGYSPPDDSATDHRTNDNHLVFYYDDNAYWKHHRFGYSPPDDDSATDDDYQHYDHIFGSYNDGDDFHPAYRTAYNDYLATKRQPTTA